jgi:2-methylisocitrate lyase-like PEP mutase family enzyme
VPIEEMLQRICAARTAASDIVIVARLDCLIHEGMDETLKRVRAYQEAGAEMLFVNGIKTLDELKRVAESASVPLLHNMSGSDLSPDVSDEQARELGVVLVIYPIHAARAATKAATRVLTHIAKGEAIPRDEMLPFRDYFELAGWEETETFERAALDAASKRPVLR